MKFYALTAAFAATLCAQAPTPAPTPAPSPAAVAPETVVAKVDGKDVTADEVRKMMENAPPQLVQAYRVNPAMAIQGFFLLKYLASEGEKLKLADETPVKEQLESIREQVLYNAMVNHERNHFPVTPEQMDEFYARNQSRYEQVKVKVILIKFRSYGLGTGTSAQDLEAAARGVVLGSQNQRSETDAEILANGLVKKIRDGANFTDLVAQYSEDPVSKAAGGEFGLVKHTSSYPEEFKRTAFALKPGDVGGPVRESTGYYIIQGEEKSLQPIDEVRASIVQEIRQAHLADFMNGLGKRFTPQIENPEFFHSPAPKTAVPLNPPAPAKQ